MKIVLPISPRTKKNSSQIIYAKGRPMVIPSKQYKAFEQACKPYLDGVVAYPIDYPINIKCEYYMGTRRRVDLSNLISATDDILVKYGVIEDDNRNIVAGHDGSRVLYDKAFPRTEITIEQLEGEYEVWGKA